ncbi:PREDICTED: tyramine beta-hydroxylase [Ceratosolen solmsi marchali]|uniref:Tyramine beta-hydroxylase n=1 Tax=Ceratosolen solmsi marchali TaxID=326594 RepID=A0AAJ6VJM3_9HYME|nr:PREDICTED: tyramine beta-hydroxylase [Ceratosolen solmsi marchali]
MKLLFVGLALVATSWALASGPDDVHALPLGSEASLHWRVALASERIIAEVHYTGEENSWFAVGFSDYGKLRPADYCIFWTNWHRETHLQDAWSDDDGNLNLDEHQDCTNFEWKKRGNVTKFTFTRQFDTCDDHDYIIERGTTHLVWLKGAGPLSSLAGLRVGNAKSSGMSRTEMLRLPRPRLHYPPDTWQYEVRAERVQVPNAETTYWCRVHKLPSKLKRKHHVLQFAPVIQQGNEHLVHHMEIFHCIGPANLEIPMYNGPCDASTRPERTQVCKKVLAAWAMGADAFVYPEEAGLPIGGEEFNRHVMLEIHYNNPELQADVVDSSGLRFVITESLRKYDAGVIELGLEYTDKMAIPPGQESFVLSGHCVAECTGVGLPQSGIKIFGSQLHTHLTGKRVVTRHARDGQELPLLNYDNHYSTHFQEIRLLPRPVTVLPGDTLITSCTYETLDRANVTLGGFAISDEMCVNYIHYYPNSRLEVCKSAISDDALRTYFRYLREWENQGTNRGKGISDNYKSIEWTKIRIAALHDLYEVAPLGMQCNGSDGSRLPGLWDNIATTPIRLPLAPPARSCAESGYEINADEQNEI